MRQIITVYCDIVSVHFSLFTFSFHYMYFIRVFSGFSLGSVFAEKIVKSLAEQLGGLGQLWEADTCCTQ